MFPFFWEKGGKKNQDFKNSQTNAEEFLALGGTGFEPHSPSTGIYLVRQVDPFFAFGLIEVLNHAPWAYAEQVIEILKFRESQIEGLVLSFGRIKKKKSEVNRRVWTLVLS